MAKPHRSDPHLRMAHTSKCCIWCGKPLPKYKRKYCSWECNDKYYAYIIHPEFWNVAKAVALDEANHKCEECGATANLEVHHIEPLEHLEERFNSPKNNQANLRVLCRGCHKKTHVLLRSKAKSPAKQKMMEFNYG